MKIWKPFQFCYSNRLNNCCSIDWTIILCFFIFLFYCSINWTIVVQLIEKHFCVFMIFCCSNQLNDCCSINWTTLLRFFYFLILLFKSIERLIFNQLNNTFAFSCFLILLFSQLNNTLALPRFWCSTNWTTLFECMLFNQLNNLDFSFCVFDV